MLSGKWMNVDNVEKFANLIIQECNKPKQTSVNPK